MKRLAIIQTHPIQYYSPLYQLITKEAKIRLKVFYTWSQTKNGFFDPKFKKHIKWDIPLLEGYEFEFVENTAKKPGSQHFFGVKNPDLISKIKSWNPDAILVIGWKHYSHLKAMFYFHKKIPILFRGDSTLLDEKNNLKKVLRRNILKFVYSFVDYALYVGKANKDYFLAHGLTEKQLVFAPHAIDNDRFADKTGEYEKQAKKWRAHLNINDHDIVFIFVGKFEKKKNPILLLKAFKKIEAHKNYKIIFVGNGELEGEMKKIAAEDKRIKFLPFQNQSKMPVVYRLGDILVLPSVSETWGLAVNEAMASGLAIVVSDKVGCAPDLVFDNINGFVFENNNQNDLYAKLTAINHDNLIKFKQKSSEIIQKYSFDKIAKAIYSIML